MKCWHFFPHWWIVYFEISGIFAFSLNGKKKLCTCVQSVYVVLLIMTKICMCHLYMNWLIGQVGRVFTNGPGDLGSISVCVIPMTLKMVLDTSFLNTQQYKVHIKGKVEQSRERSSTLPYTLV